ncbi:MAG TPA: hypothetical protein VHD81_01110 [Mycobacteriales bacterium]|nr:hypothetical protein [Mycobacteriales bacterium]
MIFRARLTRAARGSLCALLAVGFGWAIHAEITFYGVDTTLRIIALVPTVIMEIAYLVGLWRLWVVCLIVNESGAIVRNFRGDIPVRRTEIREVIAVSGATGSHVALQLKIGDVLHLDGLAFASAGRTDRAVQEISQALGRVKSEDVKPRDEQ